MQSRPASGHPQDGGRLASTSMAVTSANMNEAIHCFRLAMVMDVAFISEFVGQNRVFRYVDTDLSPPPIQQGQTLSLKHGYCRKVVDGELPELIQDAARLPAAVAIPETAMLPIGSHMSVPVRLSDGSLFGTFCCFSSKPNKSLNGRSLQLMRSVAALIAIHLEAGALCARARSANTARIRSQIALGEPTMVYQPVVRLADRAVVGAEALARFHDALERPPCHWFSEAMEVGLGADLELQAISNAVQGFSRRWKEDINQHLAVNVSAATLIDSDLSPLLRGLRTDRLILEVTEHEPISDYIRLDRAVASLRRTGVKLAVDDTGSGYASLHHVLKLHPDFVKLDISITRGVDSDISRRAMIASVQDFAEQTACTVVAEGIETEAECATLRDIGVQLGQGYLLGRPGPIVIRT